jgi:hypothetical protein
LKQRHRGKFSGGASSKICVPSRDHPWESADTVLVLRYFEAFGEVRRAISLLKKRTGRHENTIREFSIGNTGLKVGPPLDKFQGVLRGVPQYVGGQMDSKP